MRRNGILAEDLRLPFRLPRGHFLDQRVLDFAGRLSWRLFQGLESCRQVLREREEERDLAEDLRLPFRLPRGHFLAQRVLDFAGRLSWRLFQGREYCRPVLRERDKDHSSS